MKQIITVNILLMIILPIYITHTKFGSIEFGEFFAAITIIFTITALFYTAVSIASLKDKNKWKKKK